MSCGFAREAIFMLDLNKSWSFCWTCKEKVIRCTAAAQDANETESDSEDDVFAHFEEVMMPLPVLEEGAAAVAEHDNLGDDDRAANDSNDSVNCEEGVVLPLPVLEEKGAAAEHDNLGDGDGAANDSNDSVNLEEGAVPPLVVEEEGAVGGQVQTQTLKIEFNEKEIASDVDKSTLKGDSDFNNAEVIVINDSMDEGAAGRMDEGNQRVWKLEQDFNIGNHEEVIFQGDSKNEEENEDSESEISFGTSILSISERLGHDHEYGQVLDQNEESAASDSEEN